MDWQESIKDVQEARENNRLVIFVGSGVSRNSDIPTWGDLIEKIAKKIRYKEEITQDKYLLIPEYYYLKDRSRKHTKYYKFISDALATDKGSNAIDEIIFSILPEHIITTNYDFLLENTTNPNVNMYEVIAQDSDLLSKANNRYIIKMHGSLDNPQTIVLKESDYIDYEQNHPLISTYIRSLLINHTFLFVGYSLNDNNLNLIIGWIEYFRKQHDVSNRPKNILIVDKEPTQFEQKRLENKNIFPINIMLLPDEIEEKCIVPNTLTSSIGRKIYSYFKCIYSPESLLNYMPFERIVEEKYQILSEYNFISFQDLLSVQRLGNVDVYANELFFYEEEWFNRIKLIINSSNEKIIKTLNKSPIRIIGFKKDIVEIPELYEHIDNLHELFLLNDYKALISEIENCKNNNQKLFYSIMVGKPQKELLEIVKEIEHNNQSNIDYITLIISKMSIRLVLIHIPEKREEITKEIEHIFEILPAKYKDSTKFLKELFESTASDYKIMNDLLDKVEERYSFNRHSFSTNHSLYNVYKLYSYAYNYYNYIFHNYYPLDPNVFNDAKIYLSYYIKAVLCTYSPQNKYSGNDFFDEEPGEKYVLGDFEIEIITKFILPSDLSRIGKKYSINLLIIDESVDIVNKIVNLCESYSQYYQMRLSERIGNQIYNLSYIIHYGITNIDTIKIIFNSFIDMFNEVYMRHVVNNPVIWDAVCLIINSFPDNQLNDEKAKFIDVILNGENYTKTINNISMSCYRIISRLSEYISRDTQNSLCSAIDNISDDVERIRMASILIDFLPQDKYQPIFIENIDKLNSNKLFDFIRRKIIPYNNQIMHIIKSRIEEKESEMPKNGVKVYPDQVQMLIDNCILLHLMEYINDLSELKSYEGHSEQLQFILDPVHFNYSVVNLNDYRWINLMRSEKYNHFFVEHKNDFLSDDIKRAVSNNKLDDYQYKTLYGFLLKEDDLFSF